MKLKQILLGTLLAAGALSAHAQTQLANSGFENWESVSGGQEPVSWSSFLTATGDYKSTVAKVQLTQDSDHHSGNYSAKVYARDVMFGIVAQGNLTTGCINGGSMTATDANGNYNYTNISSGQAMRFTGRPDAMKVWVKSSTKETIKIAAYLHADGYFQDPPEGNKSKQVALIASATAAPASNGGTWTEYTVPFSYRSADAPAYALVSFATCSTPGGGAASDVMYVDDVEMVYYSELLETSYAGQTITFDATNSATVNAAYNAKLLKYRTGAGADVKIATQEDGTVTITIYGGNYADDSSNVHTYVLHFTKGIDAGLDDEPLATVNPEVNAIVSTFGTGVYYIGTTDGKYLDEGEQINVPEAQKNGRLLRWTVTGTPGNYQFKNDGETYDKSQSGQWLYCERKSSAENFAAGNFNTWSSGPSAANFTVAEAEDNTWAIYLPNVKYFDGSNGIFGFGKKDPKYGDIYLAFGSDSKLTCSMDPYGWVLYYADKVDFINNASEASLSNPLSAAALVEPDATVKDLPLGLYSVSGTGSVTINGKTYTAADGMFYVPFENTTTFTGTPGLNYYGRLNFDLTATYNDASVKSDDVIDDVYDADLFVYSANGNGVEKVEKVFDPETNTLTVTVSGYGRSREYTFQFAAADLSLNATWYGESVEDGQTIDEEFSEAGLNVTPGKGATVTTDAAEDGTVTITLTSGNDSQTYTLHFLTYPAETADAVTVSGALVASYDNAEATHVPTLGINYNADGNLNLHISALVDNASNQYENIVVKNVSLDAAGNFYYADNVRNAGGQLVPTIVRGQVKDGQLVAAAIDASLINPSIVDRVKRVFMHATYGFAAADNKPFAGSIVVTVNGDATEIENQTINVVSLDNGNISFTLNDFAMPMGSDNALVGNIAIDNLAIDADGNFAYNGGILIGPGSNQTHEWMGLDMGIIPLDLRGQVYDYEGKQQLIVVIDINLQESLGQTVHVTFGADAVTTDRYQDYLHILVNGEKTVIPHTQVEIGTLRNGNVNLVLKDFMMGDTPVGNIAIDNVPLDAKGNFVYDGVIRIGKGSSATVSWIGPELGDVPVTLRGAICTEEYDDCNGVGETDSHCILVLDVDMQESLQQTIHITYGLGVVDTKKYTDILAVTVNGETTTQEQEVTVQYLPNGNINFSLNNFYLDIQAVGAISIENLIVDAQGKFTFDGSIRIGKGSKPGVEDWLGPSIGDVPLQLDGQLFTKDGQNYLLVNIDIDLEESLKQTVNVTFGATPVSTKTYTDDLLVTVNGESTSQEATITVGELKNGYINVTLNNFTLGTGAEAMAVGNIAFNALELDENGHFNYNGNVRIGDGDLDGVDSWLGPTLGAIPVDMKGQLFEYEGQQYVLVSIAIEMESLGQTIDVLFGGTPVRTLDLTDNLSVSVNGSVVNQTADVTVGILRNGNINFTLRNFMLATEGGEPFPVGNLAINNMEIAEDGTFSYSGNIRIGNGDDANVASWAGPTLGDIPVVMTGKFSEKNEKLHAVIDIELESLQQIVNVEFGADFVIAESIGDVVKLINDALAGNATVKDIEDAVNMILGK